MNNYEYPLGSDTSEAPWNTNIPKEQEIEVYVSVTLSKPVKIAVTDYEVEKFEDEDGIIVTENNYNNCDLKGAVIKQIDLPGDETWNVDDFEVVLN